MYFSSIKFSTNGDFEGIGNFVKAHIRNKFTYFNELIFALVTVKKT